MPTISHLLAPQGACMLGWNRTRSWLEKPVYRRGWLASESDFTAVACVSSLIKQKTEIWMCLRSPVSSTLSSSCSRREALGHGVSATILFQLFSHNGMKTLLWMWHFNGRRVFCTVSTQLQSRKWTHFCWRGKAGEEPFQWPIRRGSSDLGGSKGRQRTIRCEMHMTFFCYGR